MFRLALRNVFRQKLHTAITLAAIIGGVSGIILAGGWVHDVLIQLSEAFIHSQSGHLQVYKSGFFLGGSQAPEKYLIRQPDAIKGKISAKLPIDSIMARLNFSGLLNNGRSDLPIIGEGVEPGREAALGSALLIVDGRRLSDNDEFGVVVGHGLAKSLNLRPGDNVTLVVNTIEGALNSLDFEVIGIFESFSKDYDARAIKIPLAASQELMGTQSVNALVVVLNKTSDTDWVAGWLKKELDGLGLEVKTWVELNDFYEKTVELYKGQFGVLQLIILVLVLLSVANSVNMSIFNRAGEFGTMMALGNRSRDVFILIVAENVLMGLIGSGLGLAFGIALALFISAIGIQMPPPPNSNLGYIAHIQIIPSVLLLATVVGIAATVLASILPARRVSHTPVVAALRQNF
jgi:putative ABC transport system permease protein